MDGWLDVELPLHSDRTDSHPQILFVSSARSDLCHLLRAREATVVLRKDFVWVLDSTPFVLCTICSAWSMTLSHYHVKCEIHIWLISYNHFFFNFFFVCVLAHMSALVAILNWIVSKSELYKNTICSVKSWRAPRTYTRNIAPLFSDLRLLILLLSFVSCLLPPLNQEPLFRFPYLDLTVSWLTW